MVDFEKMQAKIESQGEMIEAMYKLLFSEKKGLQVQDDKPMSAVQASEFLGISIRTVYKRKEIPSHKEGKKLYFFKHELISYANGNLTT